MESQKLTQNAEDAPKFIPNETTLLAIRAASDAHCMGALWQSIERLVNFYARRYCMAGVLAAQDMDDYIQQGYIALSEAVASYDIASNTQFSTWLCFYLRAALKAVTGKKSDASRHCMKTETEDRDGEALDIFDIIPDETAERDYSAIEDNDAARFLLRKIESLADERAKEMLLANTAGQTWVEIAAAAGIKIGKARAEVLRARCKLIRDKEIRAAYPNHCKWYGETLHKGLAAFNTSWSSVVEDAVIKRETMKERQKNKRLRLYGEDTAEAE